MSNYIYFLGFLPLLVVLFWNPLRKLLKLAGIIDKKQILESEKEWKVYFFGFPPCRNGDTRESHELIKRLRSGELSVVQKAIHDAKATGHWDYYSTAASEHGLFTSWNNISEIAIVELIANGARVRRYSHSFEPVIFQCSIRGDALRKRHLAALLEIGCGIDDQNIDRLTLAGRICRDTGTTNLEQAADDLVWLVENGASLTVEATRLEVMRFIGKLSDGINKTRICAALASQDAIEIETSTDLGMAAPKPVRL